MNGELKKSVDMTLAKANRSTQFDIAKVCDQGPVVGLYLHIVVVVNIYLLAHR
jgi:hypothetical protein